MAATPFITIKDLCMDFPESGVATDENQTMIRVLDNINLEISEGEIVGEARVRKAFGASTQALALEKKSPHAKLEKTATASLPADDGSPRKPLLRASQIFDEVSEIVLQMLMDDVKKEKQGNGCF